MKKFTKVSLIVTAVLLGVGILFCGISSVMGAGLGVIRSMARNGEFDTGNWHISDTGIYYGDSGAEWEEWDENWDSYDGDYEGTDAEGGNSVRYNEYALSSVKNIALDVGAASVYVKPSRNADKISVELRRGKEEYYECGLNGETLEISYDAGAHYDYNFVGHHTPKLVISVPEGASLKDVNLDVGAAEIIFDEFRFECENFTADIGAGRLEAEWLEATKQAEISVGAGEVIIEDGKYKDITAECDMGNIELGGRLEGDLTGTCSMGNITIDLFGRETDYNYTLFCSMGNLEVNGKEYSGLDGDYEKMNDGAEGKMITLECDMGNVELNIEE